MKKIIFTSLVGAFAASSLFAQVQILNEGLSPTGVSNEGIVAGSYGQAAPYFLWNPETDTKKEIGGISAGNGYGGQAKFSADGKYLSGTMETEITISTDWKKTTLLDRDYTITGMCYPTVSMGQAFIVGKNPTDDTKGVFLKTGDGGMSFYDVINNVQGGLEAVCFLNDKVGLIGGRNAYFAYTTSQGRMWDKMTPRPTDNKDNVVAYRTIDFIQEEPYVGVVGAELADGQFAVYQSPDGAETWQVATGVKGIPNHIIHVGGTFFMGTQDGRIQKSVDNGLTWTEVFKTGGFLQYGGPIFKIRFVDDKIGIALSDLGMVYRTTNGGTSWTLVAVDSEVTNVSWNDLVWMDSKNVTIVGTKGKVYSSADAGLTWTSLNIEEDGVTDLHMVCKSENVLNIGGIHGNVYRKSLIDKKMAGGLGRYDVEAEKWTPLGNFGCIKDVSTGSGYAISGDGKTVVGLAYRYNPTEMVNNGAYTTAVAWTEEKGMIELGSLYSNIDRATRANAVSHDGSVVVGWQDRNGPWYSAVWRKEAAGGYAKNEYIMIDPSGAANESNYMTQCSAVSPNGKWIGGYGRSIASGPMSILEDDQLIANQPWIWSQETGVKRLGVIPELVGMDGAVGNVTNVNDDGTIVVGFWVIDKSMYAFIWTEKGGMQNLNTYITDNYDYDLGDNVLCSVLAMSPNGRYIAGWGLDMAAEGVVIAFTMDLNAPTNIIDAPESESCHVKVYPNPVSDVLHIDLGSDASAKIRLTNMQGCTVLQDELNSSAAISLNGLAEGLYMLETTVNGVRKINKIEVLH